MPRMQLPVRPLAASAFGAGGGGYSAVIHRSVHNLRGRTCRKVISFSSSGKGGEEGAARRETPEEARKRLAELDALLEGLVEPKMRPPTPPPPPESGEVQAEVLLLAEYRLAIALNANTIFFESKYYDIYSLLLETDPYLDRAVITGRGSTDEMPEFSPTYVAFSTLALVILTIFTNVMFNLYIKPSVDGFDPPERIQRTPLVNPADRPSE